MVDYYKYRNEFVFTLPETIQQDILNILNDLHNRAWACHRREYRVENEDARVYCREYYNNYKNQLNIIIDFLNRIKIYPAIGWFNHSEYFFPTEEDCLLEEERYWKCID